MRTGKMKNVLKKIGAFALAFMMAVPVTGGWPATVGAAIAKFEGGKYFELEVVQLVGGVEEPITADDKLSLEEGDELRLKIRTVSGQQINDMEYFKGSLAFTAWDAREKKQVDIGDCFGDIHLYDYASYVEEVKPDKAGRYHEFTLTSTNPNGTYIADGVAFLGIDLRVKRAVDKDVCIKFQGADPKTDNCFELKKKNYTVDYFTSIEKTITNKWYGERMLSFTVAGNSESTDNTIDVPVKNTKTKKTKIAVQINKENGTDRGVGKPGYSGFVLSCTYNPNYLTLDSYELSKEAKEYQNAKGITMQPYLYDETGGKKTVTISFMSKNDIDVYGDFLYLTFVPANGSQELGLADDEANVEVTLKGGVNSATTTMKTEVKGGQPYLDKDSNIIGGTKIFQVNFVQSLIRFGDVNNDTYVNLIDAMLVLQHCNGERTLTADEMERANTNDSVGSDGKPTITLIDVILIMKYVNEEIKELPVDISQA